MVDTQPHAAFFTATSRCYCSTGQFDATWCRLIVLLLPSEALVNNPVTTSAFWRRLLVLYVLTPSVVYCFKLGVSIPTGIDCHYCGPAGNLNVIDVCGKIAYALLSWMYNTNHEELSLWHFLNQVLLTYAQFFFKNNMESYL